MLESQKRVEQDLNRCNGQIQKSQKKEDHGNKSQPRNSEEKLNKLNHHDSGNKQNNLEEGVRNNNGNVECEDLRKGKCLEGIKCKYSHHINLDSIIIKPEAIKSKEIEQGLNRCSGLRMESQKSDHEKKSQSRNIDKKLNNLNNHDSRNKQRNSKEYKRTDRVPLAHRNHDHNYRPPHKTEHKRTQEQDIENKKYQRSNENCKYLKRGKCLNGIYCKYNHKEDINANQDDNQDYNEKQKEIINKPCWYHKTGICKKGKQCNFRHEICKYHQLNKCIYGSRCINIHIEKETINLKYEKYDDTEYNNQINDKEYERAEQQVNDGVYFEDRIQNIYEQSYPEYDETVQMNYTEFENSQTNQSESLENNYQNQYVNFNDYYESQAEMGQMPHDYSYRSVCDQQSEVYITSETFDKRKDNERTYRL